MQLPRFAGAAADEQLQASTTKPQMADGSLPGTTAQPSPAHLHDHAQVLVVEDEALGVELLHSRSRQLLAVHDEAADVGWGKKQKDISWASVAKEGAEATPRQSTAQT